MIFSMSQSPTRINDADSPNSTLDEYMEIHLMHDKIGARTVRWRCRYMYFPCSSLVRPYYTSRNNKLRYEMFNFAYSYRQL